MDTYVAEGRVLFGADETETPRRKLFLEEHGDQAPLPTFSQRRDVGTNHLEAILGEHRFTNPKDHRVLARWFSMMAGPDATILDFFAGSGTTGEAVMQLNAADGGNRRAILVTSNEVSAVDQKVLSEAGYAAGDDEWEKRGVYQRVCAPRIETVVTGVREDGSKYSDGFDENVVFARVSV
jgi:adenine-specific DNA-methyltransferase